MSDAAGAQAGSIHLLREDRRGWETLSELIETRHRLTLTLDAEIDMPAIGLCLVGTQVEDGGHPGRG